MTLCKKKAKLRMFLKLLVSLRKQEQISGVCLGNIFIATMWCPENNCMYRKSHHCQLRQNMWMP